MIKVLFKSEELLKTLRVTPQKIPYLSNLTPKNGEEAMSILATSKYVEHIKVTTKTEVVVKTAKSSVVKTAIAAKFNLETKRT